MCSNLRKRLYQTKRQTNGSAGVGLLLFMVALLVLIILPISIGLLEYQFFNIEKEQVKAATENTINSIYESMQTQPLSRVVSVPELSGFEADLSTNLEVLGCTIVPENITVEFVGNQWLLVTFDYKHVFKSFDLEKPMAVFLKYWLPKDQ